MGPVQPASQTHAFSSVLDVTNPPMCTGVIQVYGQGCPGAGGFVPMASYTGCPAIRRSITLDLSNVTGGARGAIVLGAGSATIPVGSCTLLVQPPLLAVPVQFAGPPGVAGAGTARSVLTMPDLPVNVGLGFAMQTFVLDPGTPAGLAASSAAQIFIGL